MTFVNQLFSYYNFQRLVMPVHFVLIPQTEKF